MSNPPNLHHFPLYPARAMALIIDMSPEERGSFFTTLLQTLIGGKPTGDIHLADEMIEEATQYYIKKQEAGRKGGLSTQSRSRAKKVADQSTIKQCLTPPQAIQSNETEQKDIQDNTNQKHAGVDSSREGMLQGKLEGKLEGLLETKPLSAQQYPNHSQNKLHATNCPDTRNIAVADIAQKDLAQFAAKQLEDENMTQAVIAYKKVIKRIGPEEFRSLLDEFMGEINRGEHPALIKPGAVFYKYFLKPAMVARRDGGAS